MRKRAAPSSSSSFKSEWTYDVFLSFRGVDTRNTFTSHLYNSLHQKGIITFFDNQGLQKGEEITPALLKAIQESRIAIIIFSQNYASSTFCLDELVQILRFSKEEGRLVWPIFYDVDPCQVRHQIGTYAQALAKHEERFKDDKDKVHQWRKALFQAANLSGWHFKHESQSEDKFIIEVVQDVSKKINRPPLHVAEKLVGLKSPVLKVASLLRHWSDEGVNIVGIHGIGGIGKTTIARTVYNLIANQFESLCFLADIREKAINKHGLAQLQETILCEILGEKDIKVGDVNRGIPLIKRRLQQKKVLLILDDVDKLVQLKVLAGGCDWFGSGSKIIITTRDKHLLITHGIVNLYEVEQLSDEEALELFSWHAFKSNKVDPSYVDISDQVVFYARGLPLAVEVIGSHLFGKSLDECYSALDKYKKIPHKDIHELLKVSYDGLEEDEKGIFLDIACFFNNYKMDFVKEMLHAHGFYAEDGIGVLANKSLLKIDHNGHVRMHDLIQDMGREIVRQESTIEPGKRSRLWFDEDIIHVLEENTGTGKIEVIKLEVCNNKEVQWNGKTFEKMKNLRILMVGDATFSTGPEHLSNSLRVLDWSCYPLPSLPSTFNPKKLMILKLAKSCLQFFQPLKSFESLLSITFEGCKFLMELPSLCEVPLLRRLCVDNCTKLVRIDESVGFLDKLLYLSAKNCTQLESLVPCINLPSLEVLNLTECIRLKHFPEVLGKMNKIRDIYLDYTDIIELPLSIENLIGLECLYLRGCRSLNQLPHSVRTLPKVEVIIGYGWIYSERFKLFEGNEKLISKSQVCPGAMVIMDDKGTCVTTRLDVYSGYISPNNVLQLCDPNLLEQTSYELLFKKLDQRQCLIKDLNIMTSMESSTRFWFRNKFPKITLCCSEHHVGYLMYFKFKVTINGTEQFSSSCTNITQRQQNSWRQVLMCDIECKEKAVFSEHEWNEVKILCQVEFPRAELSHSVMYMPSAPPRHAFIKWTHIYVDKEQNIMDDIKFYDPMRNQAHSYYYSLPRWMRMGGGVDSESD